MKKYRNLESRSFSFKTGFKVALIFETVAIAGCYILWKKLNDSQELRYKVYQKSPKLLEYYYQVADMYNADIRKSDQEAWKN